MIKKYDIKLIIFAGIVYCIIYIFLLFNITFNLFIIYCILLIIPLLPFLILIKEIKKNE